MLICIQKYLKNLCDQNGGRSSGALKMQFLKILPNFGGFYFIRGHWNECRFFMFWKTLGLALGIQQHKTMKLRGLGSRDPQNWYFCFIWLVLPYFSGLHFGPTKQGKVYMEYQYSSSIIWSKIHAICVDLNKFYHLRIRKIVKNKLFYHKTW